MTSVSLSLQSPKLPKSPEVRHASVGDARASEVQMHECGEPPEALQPRVRDLRALQRQNPEAAQTPEVLQSGVRDVGECEVQELNRSEGFERPDLLVADPPVDEPHRGNVREKLVAK